MTEQPRLIDEAEPDSALVGESPNSAGPSAATGEAQPGPAAPPVARGRRVLPALLRWTAALAVLAAAGTATAYGIAGMERTDVPGLATESDGRWDFPQLTKPPLPAGSPGPFAKDNAAGTHHADLRALVLPAPEGAKEDKTLRGSDGWLATKDYLAEYELKEDRDALGQRLVDLGLRHIAARGWTTPDGTRTRVYLLRFGTATVVEEGMARYAASYSSPVYQVRGAGETRYDSGFPGSSEMVDIARTAYVEAKPYGAEQVRQAYLVAGDVYAVILQSRKGTAEAVPFQQTVTLQSQLLG
ncbi:hypothetical protein GCM10023084_16280 [Streptomyces lacrimifluminis]|uniref:Uncharacterized protein n=1 Tax=Streptomyces lacrimifluminis TaxID=1500077 RepID=A0A917NKT1_9ACTN|nr:hypothetical protein [Streptomyces lacrimifluminis]GGJ07862.1 hypothetical protein GCM10012282_00650 [Streptomyces lacrimifluminis]